MDQVVHEEKLCSARYQGGYCDEFVHRNKRLHVIRCERLVTTDIAGQSDVMERHEDGVRAYKCQPEMDLADSLVHHASEHLREPEIGPGKDPEHRGHPHHHVEVPDHEISSMQQD